MKIPDEAQCVFKGEIFDVYQWQQKMFDGSFRTFERIKRPNTLLVIPATEKGVLIGFEEQPDREASHGLIGGRQEPNEEPLEGVKRELLEETGFESDDWELFTSYEPHRKIDWTVYVYIARNCRKVAEQNLDPGERIEIKEVSFEDFFDFAIAKEFGDEKISNDMFRIQHTPGELEKFRKKLFPTKDA